MKGFYVYRLDTSSGALEYVSVATGIDNPSFLDLHPHKPYLYAINEISESDGQSGGAITAFSIDEGTGELTRLNHQSTVGPGPCHLSVDATGKFVLVANYGGGSVCMLPIHEDGNVRGSNRLHTTRRFECRPGAAAGTTRTFNYD